MTAPETAIAPLTSGSASARLSWRRWLLFGDGLGLEIVGRNLDAAIVRMRPGGASLIAATTIADFRTRPAAEWGAELSRFLAAAGESHLAATIILPREEVVIRTMALPGVPEKDIRSAIELQIDSLHPWAGEEIAWSWTRVSVSAVLLGMVRGAVLSAWETLFSEAGVGVAAVTFSAAAIHSALRLRGTAPASLLLYNEAGARLEVYGESDSRPVYSAEFNTARDRALPISRSELRLPADAPTLSLKEALHAAACAGALSWTAGMVSAVPLTARLANLVPASRRASHSRVQYAVPAALAALLILALLAVFVVLPAVDRNRIAAALAAEIQRLEPVANRAQALERNIAAARARTALLADFRSRTQADLNILSELSRILPAQVWTNQLEMMPDSVIIAGEADQASPLLRLLDASPLFQNSEFALSVVRNGQQAEQFRIRTLRRGRSGRTTP